MELTKEHCEPCEGHETPLAGDELKSYTDALASPWEIQEDKTIKKLFTFTDFVKTMAFVNQVADIAEAEQHHPDLYVSYGKCSVELWTHAIGGLSKNDFIVAAKIDELSA